MRKAVYTKLCRDLAAEMYHAIVYPENLQIQMQFDSTVSSEADRKLYSVIFAIQNQMEYPL